MIQYALDCVTTVLNAILCFMVMYRKFDFNRNKIFIRLIVILLSIFAKIGIVFFQIPPLNFISSFVMVFAIIKLPYKCSYSKALIYSTIFIMLTLVADSFGVLIISLLQNVVIYNTITATPLIVQNHILDCLFQIVFARVFDLLIKKENNEKVKWHEIAFYVILILFETAVFAYVSYMAQNHAKGTFIILMMAGFVVLDVYMMYILHKISSSREAEHEIELMHQQEQLQMQMYLELQKKYDLSRSVTHDVNRHIRSLEKLVEHNSTEKAKQYFIDLHKSINRLNPMVKNQNTMLAIILNTAAEKAETEKIKLDMDIEDFSIAFMRDIDITTIFSNILDNAIEACCELPIGKRKIHIILRNKLDLMILRMTNSCVYNTDHEIPIHSSKAGHSGIGLLNVKNVVEQYDGVMEIICKDNQFQIAITIPINNN